jgi:hypothetical protein
MTLYERVKFVTESAKRGYLIGQWNIDGETWLASHENNKIGFYLHEIVEFMMDCE